MYVRIKKLSQVWSLSAGAFVILWSLNAVAFRFQSCESGNVTGIGIGIGIGVRPCSIVADIR